MQDDASYLSSVRAKGGWNQSCNTLEDLSQDSGGISAACVRREVTGGAELDLRTVEDGGFSAASVRWLELTRGCRRNRRL